MLFTSSVCPLLCSHTRLASILTPPFATLHHAFLHLLCCLCTCCLACSRQQRHCHQRLLPHQHRLHPSQQGRRDCVRARSDHDGGLPSRKRSDAQGLPLAPPLLWQHGLTTVGEHRVFYQGQLCRAPRLVQARHSP